MSDAPPSAAAPAAPAPAPSSVGGLGLRGLALAVLVAALAIGSGATALASLAAFQRTLMTTVDSRLSEVATEVARHIENGLQAGVALPQQRRLLAVLAEERTQAPELSAIRVLDERRRILFSTNEAEIGEDAEAGAGAARPLGAGHAEAWRRVDPDSITVGLPLTGLFGETLGSVAVALPRDAVEAQQERFALSLALGAAAITLGGGLVAALLLALLPLPGVRRLQALRRRLDALQAAAGAAQPALPAAPPEPGTVALAAPLARFEAWLGRRLGGLARREAEVRRLDETA